MISVRKKFKLKRSELGRKFRVENNNLDFSELIEDTGHRVERLGDLAQAHRTNRNKKKTAATRFKYIQIGDIDVALGRIGSYKDCLGSDAPNNARRLVQQGDVLVSTRRPTRGAVVAVPEEFDGQVCSVFFTTLRVADRDALDPGYLALFLRSSLARRQFAAIITETAYPVISDADVEEMTILLPSIEEQRRLVSLYQTAVSDYFAAINNAVQLLVGARQAVETSILADAAEDLTVPVVGLVHEAKPADDDDDASGSDDE